MPRIKFFVLTISLFSLLFYPSCNGNGESSTEANVTFRVDMGNETVSTNGVHIAGTMESPNGSIEEMLDSNDDGVYEVTLSCAIGDTVQYIYLNSNVLGGNAEVIDTLPCALSGTGNRWLEIPDNDSLILDIVCYNSCSPCVDTTGGTTASLEDLYLFKGLWELKDECTWLDTIGFTIDTTSGDTIITWDIVDRGTDHDSALIFFPDAGAYFTFGDWEGKCDGVPYYPNEGTSCFFTHTFNIEIDSSGEFYSYSFMNEENDSFLVYFTLELGVDSLNHFIYDPNILTINYFIPPAYSFASKTEVYDKINDDFDNIPDNIPDFTPVCSGSGQYLGSLFPQFQSR